MIKPRINNGQPPLSLLMNYGRHKLYNEEKKGEEEKGMRSGEGKEHADYGKLLWSKHSLPVISGVNLQI